MNPSPIPNRRHFLKAASAAGVAGAVGFPSITRGKDALDSRRLKIGLVGCGGRGTGAAGDAMTADSNVELWSMGDVFDISIEGSLKGLEKFKDRVNVGDRKFVGMDAYQKVLDSGIDVVILATPPGFRPIQFKAAVEAGKHVFCEKPMAVDSTGLRVVLESARKAKEKGLTVCAGFCWRKSPSRIAALTRVLDGAIGDVLHYHATYYTSPVKPMQTAASRPAGMSDVEWQIRNWYNFSWLSGDGYVEQAIHSVDKVGWAFGDKDPLTCMANGGRQVPFKGAEDYNIYDHFSCVYDFGSGRYATISSRQIPGCDGENADYITGTKGTCIINDNRVMITGENKWRFDKEKDANMYTNEHILMSQALRAGAPVYDGDWMCHSVFLGLMGRMAAYTGKRITWDQIINSQEDLAPDDLKWDSKFTPTPMPKPGVTKVV